jgi:MOSC domain-containing protein YiiM
MARRCSQGWSSGGCSAAPPTSVSAGSVVAVSRCATHRFSKPTQLSIRLLAGLGVAGDAHLGVTVKHRSRVARDPTQPNLRQVHLLHEELLLSLREAGFDVAPGVLGENVTTRGIDLLGLARGARLSLGATAVVEVTGLRNPCLQLDRYQPGLTAATLDRDADGSLIRKAGIMGIVLASGDVRSGDPIGVEPPAGAPERLRPV